MKNMKHGMRNWVRDRRQAGHPEKGQGLAEFALTMIPLFALLLALIALAWVGFIYVSVSSAARMGARHMLSYPIEPDDSSTFDTADEEITFIITNSMPALNWEQATIVILPESVDDRTVGTQVSVQVSYQSDLPTIELPYVVSEGSFVLVPPITLTSISRMRLE